MKTFIVTSGVMGVQADGTVIRTHGPEHVVEADYYRVQDGVLIFRTERRGNDAYNPAVRAFAPGFWADVREHRSLQERVKEFRNREYDHHARDVDLPSAAGSPA